MIPTCAYTLDKVPASKVNVVYCKFGIYREGFIFVKVNPSQNRELTVSFTDVGKPCPNSDILHGKYICFSSNANRENQIHAKISE